MAVIRDVMPAFELFQPDEHRSTAHRRCSIEHGAECVGDGRRAGQLRLAEGPHQAPERRRRPERVEELQRHQASATAASRSAR